MLVLMIDDLPDTKEEYIDIRPNITLLTAEGGIDVLYNHPVTHLYLDNDLGGTVEGIMILNRIVRQGIIIPYIKPTTRNPPALKRMVDTLSLDLGYVKDHKTGWWSAP